MANQPTDSIQRFASLLRSEWATLDARHQAGLDTEDLLDILWLAQMQSETPTTTAPPQNPDTPVVC